MVMPEAQGRALESLSTIPLPRQRLTRIKRTGRVALCRACPAFGFCTTWR